MQSPQHEKDKIVTSSAPVQPVSVHGAIVNDRRQITTVQRDVQVLANSRTSQVAVQPTSMNTIMQVAKHFGITVVESTPTSVVVALISQAIGLSYLTTYVILTGGGIAVTAIIDKLRSWQNTVTIHTTEREDEAPANEKEAEEEIIEPQTQRVPESPQAIILEEVKNQVVGQNNVGLTAKTQSPIGSSAPAKTSIRRIDVRGKVKKVGTKFYLTLPAADKEIPAAITDEVDLDPYIGTELTGSMENFVLVSLNTNIRLANKSAEVVAKPKTQITPHTVKHSWERHTLSGIYHKKAILTDHPGDHVALFSSYGMLEAELGKLLNDDLNDTELIWSPRGGSQFQATHGRYGLIAGNMGAFMTVQTAFPKNNNIKKSLIEYCLSKDFRSFQDFRIYFEEQLKLRS